MDLESLQCCGPGASNSAFGHRSLHPDREWQSLPAIASANCHSLAVPHRANAPTSRAPDASAPVATGLIENAWPGRDRRRRICGQCGEVGLKSLGPQPSSQELVGAVGKIQSPYFEEGVLPRYRTNLRGRPTAAGSRLHAVTWWICSCTLRCSASTETCSI